jgi:hypothetical protein
VIALAERSFSDSFNAAELEAPAPRRGRSTTERGYGHRHQTLRKRWALKVERGDVRCARPGCGRLIVPGTPWDLGHDDTDPSRKTYSGPEHRACNRNPPAPPVPVGNSQRW